MKLKSILETAVAMSIASASVGAPPGAGTVGEGRRSRKRKGGKVLGGMRVRKLPAPLYGMVLSGVGGSGEGGFGESALVKFDPYTAILFEDESEFRGTIDAVNSKVDNAVRQGQLSTNKGYDTSTFGLQDADGNIVRVTVNREQAVSFETDLNQILSDTENKKEIAEILFMLRDKFEILDVEWAEPITEDDPVPGDTGDAGGEEPPADGEEGDEPPADGDEPPADGEEDLELDGEGEIGDVGSDMPDIDMQKSTVELLQQVIELLKKETESRAADADVKTATAQSKLTDIEHDKQEKEIQGQQEIADMEQAEEKDREAGKHDKLIQRIAKFRASKGAEDGGNAAGGRDGE